MLLNFSLLETHFVPSWEGESMRKHVPGFLQTLPVSFSLADPVAYLFAVINPNSEYNCVESLESF